MGEIYIMGRNEAHREEAIQAGAGFINPAYMMHGDSLVSLGQRYRGKKVLVVKQEPYSLDLARQLFAVCGCAVTAYADTKMALENFAAYDLILVDAEMPGMSGFEFAREMGRRTKSALHVEIGESR